MKTNEPEKFKSIGKCIYCGSEDKKLSDEHIIPYGLNGDLIIPKSSCDKCSSITSKQELFCLRFMMGNARLQMNLNTRHPKKRKDLQKITIKNSNGNLKETIVNIRDLPMVFIGYKFPPPGIFCGRAKSSYINGKLICKYDEKSIRDYISYNQGLKLGSSCTLIFCQMLAKIAHSYAVAKFGYHAFNHRLPEYILEKRTDISHYVGGDTNFVPSITDTLHEIFPLEAIRNSIVYLTVAIQLFAFAEMPRYLVVVGEKIPNKLEGKIIHSQI